MPYALRLIGVALLASLGWWQWQPETPALATLPEPATPALVSTAPELPAKPLRLKLRDPVCSEPCTEFEIDALQFPKAPALTDAFLTAIDAPAGSTPEQRVMVMAKTLMKEAAEFHEPWKQIVKAQQLPGIRQVVVIDIDNYTYTGGAHGTNVVSSLNWDVRLQRVVTLKDMLLPAQEAAFWREAKLAHKQWLAGQPDAKSLADDWPFDKTDVLALLPNGLVLKYQPYALGPYSMGTPEIVIPYVRLAGIFKPEFLPKP
jgi:hypothetical protein